jgi:hypothetical protein
MGPSSPDRLSGENDIERAYRLCELLGFDKVKLNQAIMEIAEYLSLNKDSYAL